MRILYPALFALLCCSARLTAQQREETATPKPEAVVVNSSSPDEQKADPSAEPEGTDAVVATLPPRDVSASDGEYDKYVLIRWEASETSTSYKVFRSASPNATNLQEISKGWQKNTWLCDYGVQPSTDYYYAVMSSDGKQQSAMSKFDKGFLRKKTETAIPVQPLVISTVTPEKIDYKSGDKVTLEINLQNLLEEPTQPVEAHIFLSKDVIWDFGDKPIGQKTFSSFPGNLDIKLKETVTLPDNLLPGTEYKIIVVLATKGDILHSATGVTKIKIAG